MAKSPRHQTRAAATYMRVDSQPRSATPAFVSCGISMYFPHLVGPTQKEKPAVVTNCDHLRQLKFSPVLPSAFTEHRALMLANVLNSRRALEASVYSVRAFLKLREMLASHRDLARRLDDMENKYDAQFKVVFDAIRELMKPPSKPAAKIGFRSASAP